MKECDICHRLTARRKNLALHKGFDIPQLDNGIMICTKCHDHCVDELKLLHEYEPHKAKQKLHECKETSQTIAEAKHAIKIIRKRQESELHQHASRELKAGNPLLFHAAMPEVPKHVPGRKKR